MDTNLKKFIDGYYAALFFTEIDDLIEREIFELELSIDAKFKCELDCSKFWDSLPASVTSEIDPELAGHDFWLTRNRHESGFHDGDYLKEHETILMKACSNFGEVYIYDDLGFLQIGE